MEILTGANRLKFWRPLRRGVGLALLATPVLLSLRGDLMATDYYKLPATRRIDKDLYRSGQLLIETRFCFHLTIGEDAILKYEGSGDFSGSMIIWQDDSTCDVKRVISR